MKFYHFFNTIWICKKKSIFNFILNNQSIHIHREDSHLFSCAAYQIHKSTCKKIFKKSATALMGLLMDLDL